VLALVVVIMIATISITTMQRRGSLQQLAIELVSDAADPCVIDSAARVLYEELRSIGSIEVTAEEVSSPANAKSATAGQLTTLVLTLLGSGGAFVAMINVLRDWLLRNKDVKIRVKRGTTELEISGMDPASIESLAPQLNLLLNSAVGHD
jgi:hypothetical protein